MEPVSSWCPQLPADIAHTGTMPSRRVTLLGPLLGTPFANAALWTRCFPSLSLWG